MLIKIFVILFLIATKYTRAVIVPQELPSILSLVYSTIPQIRKGHDSRYGFGFRLGDNADIQFVVELGPQSETRPIGPDADSTSRKRAASQSQYDEDELKESLSIKKKVNKDKKVAEAANWLRNWYKDQYRKKLLENQENTQNGIDNRNKPPIVNGMLNLESNTITMVPEEKLDQLTALYKMKNSSK